MQNKKGDLNMNKWEYISIEIGPKRNGKPMFTIPDFSYNLEQLNQYGEQGWELVSVTPISRGEMFFAQAILKRIKS